MTSITNINRAQPMRSATSKNEPVESSKSADHSSDVEISDTTALMNEAEERAANTPDINEAAVADIKEALANETYEIDYENLAQKMLDFELTLFDS